MTEFNKGDIVEPTQEYRERLREQIEAVPALAGEGDRRVAAGETLQVVGIAQTPFPGLSFVLAAPMDTDISDLSAEEFAADAHNTKYDDLVLLLEEEVQGSNGVLAGV